MKRLPIVNSTMIRNMEIKVRNWKRRANHLHQIHQLYGKLVTLWEAEKADQRVQYFEKELKRKKETYYA